MTVHQKVRAYIESNGIKFNYVAEKADIPIKTFYRLINGQKVMSVEELEKICVHGLSVEPSIFLKKPSHKMRNIV